MADLYHRSSPAPRDRMRPWSSFGLFAETLFTGLLVACCGALIVTFVPAVAAGTGHLRRHLDGGDTSVRAFVADVRASWRSLWPVAVGAPLLVGVLLVNAVIIASGAVPGGGPMVAVMVALALTVAVVTLRGAARWSPSGPAARALVVDAGRASVDDPAGSLLVVAAIGCGAVLAWMFLPLVAVAPGLVSLALVAVESRVRSREP